MAMFKKACEELLKNKIAGYIYQTEKIKNILQRIDFSMVDDIMIRSNDGNISSQIENLNDFDKLIEGLVSQLKKREVEVYELKSKIQNEIEKAKEAEVKKLEIEEKVAEFRQNMSQMGEKVINDIVNSKNENVVNKLEAFINQVKKNAYSIVK